MSNLIKLPLTAKKQQNSAARHSAHPQAAPSQTERSFSGQKRKTAKQIFFSQEEFRYILAAYSAQVAKGEWKDYAIDCNAENACFSIYRHSYERPLFQITKRRNGKYWEFALLTQHRTIKRSREISAILQLLKDPLKLV